MWWIIWLPSVPSRYLLANVSLTTPDFSRFTSISKLSMYPAQEQWHFGARTFSSSGPTSWNSLTSALRDPALTIDLFRRKLKTELFVVWFDCRCARLCGDLSLIVRFEMSVVIIIIIIIFIIHFMIGSPWQRIRRFLVPLLLLQHRWIQKTQLMWQVLKSSRPKRCVIFRKNSWKIRCLFTLFSVINSNKVTLSLTLILALTATVNPNHNSNPKANHRLNPGNPNPKPNLHNIVEKSTQQF